MALYTSVAACTNAFAADASKVKDLMDYLKNRGSYETYIFQHNVVTARSLPLSNMQSDEDHPSQSQVLISVQSQGDVKSFITLEKVIAEGGAEDFKMIIDRPDTSGYGIIDDAIEGRLNPKGMIAYAVPMNLRNKQSRQTFQIEFDDFVEQAHRKYIKDRN